MSLEKAAEPKEILHMEDKVLIAKRRLAQKIEWINAVVFFDDLPVITGNRNQIITLLEQLFDNALKFSRKEVQTEILVGVEEYPNHFEFYVKDNGIGFNMEFHDRIFMLFQRLHTRAEYSGVTFVEDMIKHWFGFLQENC